MRKGEEEMRMSEMMLERRVKREKRDEKDQYRVMLMREE